MLETTTTKLLLYFFFFISFIWNLKSYLPIFMYIHTYICMCGNLKLFSKQTSWTFEVLLVNEIIIKISVCPCVVWLILANSGCWKAIPSQIEVWLLADGLMTHGDLSNLTRWLPQQFLENLPFNLVYIQWVRDNSLFAL